MRATRAKQWTIGLQLAIWQDALCVGAKSGIRLDPYHPAWLGLPKSTNVSPFRLVRDNETKQKELRLPIPANDNLTPLG